MLISPAERATPILKLGRVSSLPEKFGCDMLFTSRGDRIGIQRKEVKDLIASLSDGRLAKELRMMTTAGLARSVLVVEGKMKWSVDGKMMGSFGQQMTRPQWYGVLISVMHRNVWVIQTEDVYETAVFCQTLEQWSKKPNHRSLDARPGARGMFGTQPNDKDWGVWFLQGLEGIGSDLAGKIWDHFGGLPVAWRPGVDEAALLEVDGIGPKRAAKIARMLRHEL